MSEAQWTESPESILGWTAELVGGATRWRALDGRIVKRAEVDDLLPWLLETEHYNVRISMVRYNVARQCCRVSGYYEDTGIGWALNAPTMLGVLRYAVQKAHSGSTLSSEVSAT